MDDVRGVGLVSGMAMAVAVGGCGLVLDLDGSDAPGAGDAQAARLDAGRSDAAGDANVGEADAGHADAGGMDAGSPGCVDPSDPDLLAYYGFDDRLDEGTGLGPGSGTTSGGGPVFTDGPVGCRRALQFPPSGEVPWYAQIDDHPAWDEVQSVDLWVRIESLPAEGSAMGILVRDEAGTSEPGHFLLVVEDDGHLVFRVQPQGSTAMNPGTYICSPAVPVGEWFHVGMNVGDGEPQLFVDGGRVFEPVALSDYFWGASCPQGPVSPSPPLSNGLDWVLGANSWDGVVKDFLVGGAIDELRFRNRRIDYAR